MPHHMSTCSSTAVCMHASSLLRALVSALSEPCCWGCGNTWRHSPPPPSAEHGDPSQQPNPSGAENSWITHHSSKGIGLGPWATRSCPCNKSYQPRGTWSLAPYMAKTNYVDLVVQNVYHFYRSRYCLNIHM